MSSGSPQAINLNRRRSLVMMALELGDALQARGDAVAARDRWMQARQVLGDPAGDLQSVAVLAHLQLRLGEAQAAARLADSLQAGPCRHPLVFDLFARLGRSL